MPAAFVGSSGDRSLAWGGAMASRRDVRLRPPPSTASRSIDRKSIGRRDGKSPGRQASSPAFVGEPLDRSKKHGAALGGAAGTSGFVPRQRRRAARSIEKASGGARRSRRGVGLRPPPSSASSWIGRRRRAARGQGGGKAEAAAGDDRSRRPSGGTGRETTKCGKKPAAGPWIRVDVGARGRRGARSTSAGQHGAGKPKRSSARLDRGPSHSLRIR